MKETAFIVCEYDPFHNGHLRHLELTRSAGAKTVVCLMSGNLVQRGGLACCDKALRAKAAVLCGADLVAELPLPGVLSGASYYAEDAARTAAALGGDGTLSFGCEADGAALAALFDLIAEPFVRERSLTLCEQQHYTYPRALQAAAAEKSGDGKLTRLLAEPNTVLALEYRKAFERFAPDVDFFSVYRPPAAAHDGAIPSGTVASAKHIRTMLTDPSAFDAGNWRPYVPETVASLLLSGEKDGVLPLSADRFSVFVLSRLLSLDAEALRRTNGIGQGLEALILNAVRCCSDLNSLCDVVKSKRYTHARIRRALVSAALGVQRADLASTPAYVRVLAMNENGRRFLRERKNAFTLPVVMNLSDAPRCRQRSLDELSGRCVALCRPVPKKDDTEYAVKPFVLS